MKPKLLPLFFFLAALSTSRAQTVTTPDDRDYAAWGPGSTGDQAYGESFTVPVGNSAVESFTFTRLSSIANPFTSTPAQPINYQTYLYAFNPATSTASGSALYTSAPRLVPATGSVADANTLNLNLAPGGTYIIFISDVGVAQTGTNALGEMGGTTGSDYAGGRFYYDETHGTVAGFTATGAWITFLQNAAFTLVFGPPSPFSVPGLNANQQSVENSVDVGVVGSPSAGFSTVIVDLGNASGNASAFAQDLDELSPQKLQIMRSIAFNNFGFTAGQLDDHTASLRDGQGGFDASGLRVLDSSGSSLLSQIKGRLLAWNPAPSSAHLMSDVVDPVMAAALPTGDPNRWSTFISGNVALGNASGTDGLPNANYTTGNVTAGADYRLGEHWAVGALFGFSHTSADTDSFGSKLRVDSYSPGVYATYADRGWYANGLFTYNSNAYGESRALPFLGTTATGSPHGSQYSGNLDGGYEFKRGNWTFGPTLGLRYVNLDINGFTESGAGAADLAVNEQNARSLRSQIGGEFRYKWSWYGGKVIATPHLSAAWQHEYLDNSSGITSQFDGQGLGSFVVNTTTPDRDSAFLDLGMDTQWNDALDVFVDYQAQVGESDFVGQSIDAGLKISF
jgi:outer membrane autotransporter protein